MANNSDQNVIEIRDSSPSQGSSTVTSPVKSRTGQRAPFAPARVSHIRDEAGVTYRVVQIPTDFLPQATQITTVPATQVITSNHNQIHEVVGGGGQQIFLNANVVGNSETKIAYLPSSAAITVASPIATQPQIQLQAVDGGGQYYIMIPPGELVQTSNNVGQQNRANQSIISATATPRIQQAAFIPLSKLDGSSQSGSSGQSTLTIGGQTYLSNDGQIPPQKEVKRRVSHNEVEKRRRDKINSWINKLARLVPSACDDASKQGQSKGGILAKTVDYINELRTTNGHLADSLKSVEHYNMQRMRQQINDLTKENKILKEKLLENNIALPPKVETTSPASSTISLQQQQHIVTQTSSGQLFTTKRLIPVTMTSQGQMVIMSSSSEANVDMNPELQDVDEDDDDMDSS